MQTLLLLAVVGFAAQLVDGALGMAYGVTSTTLLLPPLAVWDMGGGWWGFHQRRLMLTQPCWAKVARKGKVSRQDSTTPTATCHRCSQYTSIS